MPVVSLCKVCGLPNPMEGELCSACAGKARSLEDADASQATIVSNSESETSLGEESDASPASGPRAGLPREIGSFTIESELARGGMGVVYRARSEKLGRLVALKLLLSGEFSSAEALERFQIEAQAVARLRHPNIVGIHEVGQQDGLHYLVMDLIEGGSLSELIKRSGPLDPQRAAQIFVQLARALAYAHSRSVLHRDLKPANILLTKNGDPVITDFGLAKCVESTERLTATGQLLGTLAYMPPEQTDGADQVDRRGDVYSLGATLYETLTGRPPFVGSSRVNLMTAVVSTEPERPGSLRVGLSRDLETICLKCLEKEPDQRYVSASHLAEDLRRYLANEPILARPPTEISRLKKWARRNPSLAVFAVLSTILCVLSTTGFFWWRARTENEALVREENARLEARAGEISKAKLRAMTAWATLREAATPTTALAMDAVISAQAWSSLDPAGEGRKVLEKASLLLGKVALQSQQWDLAEQAFARAEEVAEDPSESAALRKQVTDARRAGFMRVKKILELVRAGSFLRDEAALREAVDEIVQVRDFEVAALLCEELEAVSQRLWTIQRQTLLEARNPDATERDLGAHPLVGLDEAVNLWSTPPPVGTKLATEADSLVLAAGRRLVKRQLRNRKTEIQPKAPALLSVIARVQDDSMHVGELSAARVACQALGRLRLQKEQVVATLARYLWSEADQERAAPAALALLRLGSSEAVRFVQTALLDRFGRDEGLALSVQAALRRAQSEPLLEEVSADGYFRRALFREARDDLDGAVADFTKVLELAPERTDALINRGNIRVKQGKLKEGCDDFSAALAREPDNVTALIHRGNAYRILGQSLAAHSDLEVALNLNPGSARCWAILGFLKESEGDLTGAIAGYSRALTLAPDLWRVWEQRGNLRGGRGDPVGALTDFNRALEINPNSAGGLSGRALARQAVGDLPGALADCNQALRLDPDLAAAWVNRGKIHWEQGDLASAELDFSQAVTLSPGLARAWLNRGIIRMTLKRPAEALPDFDHAIELAPKMVGAWNLRGIARRMLGDLDGAIADCQRALKLAPEDGASWANLGVVYVQRDDYEEAERLFSKAIDLDPGNADHWLNRGSARAELEKRREAIADYTQCLAIDQGKLAALVMRGESWSTLREHAAAIRDFSKAIRLDSESARAWAGRGRARGASGDLSGAIEDLGHAVGLDPSWEGIRHELVEFLDQALDVATSDEEKGRLRALRKKHESSP